MFFSLEQFLLSRKIKGPGWLEIRGAFPGNPAVSWCKVEAVCEKPSFVSVVTNVSRLKICRSLIGVIFFFTGVVLLL